MAGSVTRYGGARHFAAGERIHTENSYKWEPEDFDALLARAGYGRRRRWVEAAAGFAVFWADN